MALVANLRGHLAEAIGTALGKDQVAAAVREATGKELYVVYASDGDPLARAVARTLESLDQSGQARWFLTYCLTAAVADERLRKLIFRSCPETLMELPPVGDLVDRVQAGLRTLLRQALGPDFVGDFRASRAALAAVARHITAMFTLKALHECLHGLQARLASGARLTLAAGSAAAPPVETVRLAIEGVCAAARRLAGGLPAGGEAQRRELDWIGELERAARDLRAGGPAADEAAAAVDTADAERIVRLQLSRLGQSIFATARLPLHPLYEALPDELQDDDGGLFEAHAAAILDLTPTVLARALKHKLWQDVENEFTPMLACFDVPSNDPLEFLDHWLRLKARIGWLAALDPDAEWARRTQQSGDGIDDRLTEIADGPSNREAIADLKEALETLHGMVALRFLAIDAGLKADCTSLCAIGASLDAVVAELSRG